MITVKDALTKARELYAENPDHAPAGHHVEGVCLVKALGMGSNYFYMDHDTEFTQDWAAVDALYDSACKSMYAVIQSNYNSVGHLIDYNAEHSTEEILGKFDEAIASCGLDGETHAI